MESLSDMSLGMVEISDLKDAHIPALLNYWFHSPAGFIEALGVDPRKMGAEEEMERGLRKKIAENAALSSSKLNAVVIEVDGRAVGFHTLIPILDGDYGVFHAHVWDASMRGKGVGLRSYPKACALFMERFGLKRILFKTPVQNLGAIRVKEKLGIREIGEELVEFGIIRAGTRARVFELTREECRALLARA